MRKLKLVVELTEENFAILKSGDIGDFDDPCGLLADMQASIQEGSFEEVKDS